MAHTTGHAACCFCFGPVRMAMVFLSTPSARRATKRLEGLTPIQKISIHALREEGDAVLPPSCTPGADFYPRPPRGGRLRCRHLFYDGVHISIHALREEGDYVFIGVIIFVPEFLSTPSVRRATG